MVIEVTYQSTKDTKDPHSQFISTQYFERDQIPDRDAMVRKSKSMGVDFDENTITINPRPDDDPDIMRDGGIPVLDF